MNNKQSPRSSLSISLGLLAAIFLWGGNNVGNKYMTQFWPPVVVAWSRMLSAGFIAMLILKTTQKWGGWRPLTREENRLAWFRGSLSHAIYMVCFTIALKCTSAAHVALYLGASPIWGLFVEERPRWNRVSLIKYTAAALAMMGVLVLFAPSLRQNHTGSTWVGECLGLVTSVIWTWHVRQCRHQGATLRSMEILAHNTLRGGVWLTPFALYYFKEFSGLRMDGSMLGIMCACIVLGTVVPFAFWNSALRFWPASRVLLFNNFIPLATLGWAWVFLNEPATPTFWMAMILVASGICLSHYAVSGAKGAPPEG